MPQVKCEFCGAYIDETAEKCPNCGAVNTNFKRIVSDTPRTIEELKEWYMARKLPPESVTRFFIGKNVEEPKAFGIYKDGSNFIVYKNKADGSRAIRYKGTDEDYAVNELYLKLKSEILNQRSRSISRSAKRGSDRALFDNPLLTAIYGGGALVVLAVVGIVMPVWFFLICLAVVAVAAAIIVKKRSLKGFLIGVVVLVVVSMTSMIAFIAGQNSLHKHDGYYSHGPNYYYVQGHDVYQYDTDDWYYYDSYDNFDTEYGDYTYESSTYEGDASYGDFKDSYYYNDDWDSSSSSSSSSSDWSSDSDYDWDSDSDWDSGGSDWDSDW